MAKGSYISVITTSHSSGNNRTIGSYFSFQSRFSFISRFRSVSCFSFISYFSPSAASASSAVSASINDLIVISCFIFNCVFRFNSFINYISVNSFTSFVISFCGFLGRSHRWSIERVRGGGDQYTEGCRKAVRNVCIVHVLNTGIINLFSMSVQL